MIGRIVGELVEKQAPELLVDAQGVGYEVNVPMTTFYSLPELGQKVVLHTHHAVSETSNQLFGFIQKRDRDFFRMLIKVNGVGPKMAISIMSIDIRELVGYLKASDISALTKVPGVGKKTAERLVVDMRDKIKAWDEATDKTAAGSDGDAVSSLDSNNDITSIAESALIALGYKPTEAAKAVARANADEITTSEELIRQALKLMLP